MMEDEEDNYKLEGSKIDAGDFVCVCFALGIAACVAGAVIMLCL